MKNNNKPFMLFIFISITVILSSCSISSTNSIATDYIVTKSNINTSEPIITPLKSTSTEQNNQRNFNNTQEILTKSEECESSCLFGIAPKKTTVNQAKEIINALDSSLSLTSQSGDQYFYYTSFNMIDKSYITITLKVENNVVQSINATISPDKLEKAISDQIFAYYKNLFSKYGKPTDFRIAVSYPTEPNADQNLIQYSFFVYYDSDNLILEYDYVTVTNNNLISLCPLSDKFDGLWLWLGEDPDHPPYLETELEKLTNSSLQQFYDEYQTNVKPPCIIVYPDKMQ